MPNALCSFLLCDSSSLHLVGIFSVSKLLALSGISGFDPGLAGVNILVNYCVDKPSKGLAPPGVNFNLMRVEDVLAIKVWILSRKNYQTGINPSPWLHLQDISAVPKDLQRN